MERLKTYFQSLSLRRNLTLLGTLLVLSGILATTYLVQQQQELRGSAQSCIDDCNTGQFNCHVGCDSGYNSCEAPCDATWKDCFYNQCAPDDAACQNICNLDYISCEGSCSGTWSGCRNNCDIAANNCRNSCPPPGPICDRLLGTITVCCPGTDFGQNVDQYGWSDGSPGICNQVFGPCVVPDPNCVQGGPTPTPPSQCNFNGVCELGEPLDPNICPDCPPGPETQCSLTRDNDPSKCWFDSDCPGSTCVQGNPSTDPAACRCVGSPSPTPTPTPGGQPGNPSVSTMQVVNSTTITGATGVQITVSGVADQIRVYVHGTNPPTASDPVSSTYNPDSVLQNTFYLIGTISGSSGTVNLAPATPTKPGRYIIVANAQQGSTTCAWNDPSCNAPGTNNAVQLDWPSITSVDTSPTSLSCASPPCRAVDVSGQAGQFWVYIHRGVPSTLSPVSTTLYNPNSMVDNTFYTIGPISQQGGILPFSDPKQAGTYYIVVNAHSQGQTSGGLPVWSTFERVCAWDDRVFRPPPATPEGSTCTNVSPSAPFTISVGGPSPTRVPTLPPGVSPTRVPTATLPPGISPTLPPGVSPTRTPTPIGGVTGIPTGIPTLGPNATGLFVSLNLEGFPGTYAPSRKTEPVEIDIRSQTASRSAQGQVAYSDVSRHFDGLVNLGDGVADGVYTLFVKATSYLRKEIGTVNIRSRAVNFVPFSPDKPLLSCDLNNDNIVNILDVSQVYTDIRRKGVRDSLADIDRDADVDIFDHNFCVSNFLTEGVRL